MHGKQGSLHFHLRQGYGGQESYGIPKEAGLKQKLLRVKFNELDEAKGAFGCEMISPGGGAFPKHLIYSYDLKTKTVIFPFGWMAGESGGTNEDNFTPTMWHFYLKPYWDTFFQHKKVKKMDFVEIDYKLKEFQPYPKLGLITLSVPRRNKNRADKLIEKYLTDKTIIAKRSRESNTTIVRIGKDTKTTEKTIPEYVYEMVLRRSKWENFVSEILRQKLIPKTDHFGLLMSNYVFPKQLANFNKNE